MSARREVRFEHPAKTLQPSSTPVHYIVDEEASEYDVNSEKSPIEEREVPQWNQRPKSTPWSSRPHLLSEKLRIRWWRDIVVDSFVVTISLPFFAIVGVVIAINGREVNNLKFLSYLEQAIKGVSIAANNCNRILISDRAQLYFQYSLHMLLVELQLSSPLGS